MYEVKDIKVIKGSIPILLSAPHVYEHRRPSITLSYKVGEPYTDDIVREICMNTGAWGVILEDGVEYDPNYHKVEENPYKKLIADIITNEKIEKVLDFHGLSDEHEYDLGIYYQTRFSKSIKLAKEICSNLDRGDLKGLNCNIFRLLDNEQETISEYVVSELRIPSIQIEIARYIRESTSLRNLLIQYLSKYITG